MIRKHFFSDNPTKEPLRLDYRYTGEGLFENIATSQNLASKA